MHAPVTRGLTGRPDAFSSVLAVSAEVTTSADTIPRTGHSPVCVSLDQARQELPVRQLSGSLTRRCVNRHERTAVQASVRISQIQSGAKFSVERGPPVPEVIDKLPQPLYPRPFRKNLPGNAPVGSPSSKVISPLTRIQLYPLDFWIRRHSPPGRSSATSDGKTSSFARS